MVRDWGKELEVSAIANILDVDLVIVNNVISRTPVIERDIGDIVSFSSTALAGFLSDPECAGKCFVSSTIIDSIFTRVLCRLLGVSSAPPPSSRETLLDALAVLTLVDEKSPMLVRDIASILNLNYTDLQNVVNGPQLARDLFCSGFNGSVYISVNLKEFLQDVDRAGGFCIPDEAKARPDARYSHYVSIYEKSRIVFSERRKK